MNYRLVVPCIIALLVVGGCSSSDPVAHGSPGFTPTERLFLPKGDVAQAACVNGQEDIVYLKKCVHKPFHGFRFIVLKPGEEQKYSWGSHLSSSGRTVIWPYNAQGLSRAGLPSLEGMGRILRQDRHR